MTLVTTASPAPFNSDSATYAICGANSVAYVLTRKDPSLLTIKEPCDHSVPGLASANAGKSRLTIGIGMVSLDIESYFSAEFPAGRDAEDPIVGYVIVPLGNEVLGVEVLA